MAALISVANMGAQSGSRRTGVLPCLRGETLAARVSGPYEACPGLPYGFFATGAGS